MSIEKLMEQLSADTQANTAALEANTAAHNKLAEVAMAAQGGKAAATGKTEEAEKPKTETAAAKKKRLAAEKKAAEEKAAAEAEENETEVEIEGEVTSKALHKLAKDFMDEDAHDEDVAALNKENFTGGLKHLGHKKFSDLEDDVERAKMAAYIGYWNAGLDVDFDEIDAKVDALGGEGNEDDPMG